MAKFLLLGPLIAVCLPAPIGRSGPAQDQPSCQFDIVSSTVVATHCSHRVVHDQVLDLFIAWRGRPGWFQQRYSSMGRGATGSFGTAMLGRVSQHQTYNDVTLGFHADFHARTVTIGEEVVSLKSVNAILIDQVERAETRRISSTRWIQPRLPLGVDVNLILARRSRELRQFLRCNVPMPAASPKVVRPQPPVVTVCEKLALKRQ
jgi:hypothetical protein